MKYGLSRAVPMGLLGFLLGMVLTFILRALQGIDPTWDPEVGIILGAIVSAVLFVGGMGAFDPAMSAHGEEGHGDEHGDAHADAHAAPAHVEAPHVSFTERLQGAINRVLRFPQSGGVIAQIVKWIIAIPVLLVLGFLLLAANVVNFARRMGGDVFLVTSITLIILFVLGTVALIPHGPAILITNDPLGAPANNGYFTVNMFGTDVVFTKLTYFAIFVVWTVISLAIAGGVIALLMSFLAREVRAVKGKPPTPEALIPPAPVRLLSRGATWLLNRLPEPPKPRR